MQIQKIALACAFAAAAISAQAADIELYGRVDAGLRYTNTDKEDTLALQAGNRSHNRIGFNIKEDLGDGLQVKAYLENGFTIDDGSLDTDGQLFNRRSILALKGSWGELGAGRMGTVQSTSSPYAMGVIKWDVMGTSYSNASIGTTFANTSRVNNALTWISPSFAGWRAGATYSLGDASDDDYTEYADRDHTLALAIDYTGENLYFSTAYSNVQYGAEEHGRDSLDSTTSGSTFGLGGWYRVVPSTKIYFGAQYQDNWETAAGIRRSDVAGLVTKNADGAVTAYDDKLSKGFDGYSLDLGASYEIGQHKLLGSVQYFDGEVSEASEYDYKLTVLGLAYEYKLAKTTWFYVAGTQTWASGKIDDADNDQEATELMMGVNWNF